MPVIRLILLLVVLGGLTLLLLQNWSPVLPLVFLGWQTQALPLAVWILLSIAAGATTSLFISSLFKVANLFSRSPARKSKKVAPSTPPPRTTTQRREPKYTPPASPAPSYTGSIPDNAADDWESNSTANDDDWDFEEDTNKTQANTDQVRNSRAYDTSNQPKVEVKDSRTYEVNSESKSGERTGSVYSYNYRDASNSGVGKTESVYDADYRVITPPYREPEAVADDDDDWGFEDDDDFKEGDRTDPKWQ